MRHRTLAAVLALFSNGGRVERFEPYGSGHIHDTFSVKYNEGDGNRAHIILQRINTHIFKDPVAVMENILRVTTHVRSRLQSVPDVDRRVLQLVGTRDGQAWLVDEEEHYWRA